MNSMPAAAHARAVPGQPSTESWSVSAIAASPQRRACAASSSGEYVPSEKWLCRWRSANLMQVPVLRLRAHLTIRAGRINSPFTLSRMPFTNLPLSCVENFLAISTASLMLTTGGMSSRCSIS